MAFVKHEGAPVAREQKWKLTVDLTEEAHDENGGIIALDWSVAAYRSVLLKRNDRVREGHSTCTSYSKSCQIPAWSGPSVSAEVYPVLPSKWHRTSSGVEVLVQPSLFAISRGVEMMTSLGVLYMHFSSILWWQGTTHSAWHFLTWQRTRAGSVASSSRLISMQLPTSIRNLGKRRVFLLPYSDCISLYYSIFLTDYQFARIALRFT